MGFFRRLLGRGKKEEKVVEEPIVEEINEPEVEEPSVEETVEPEAEIPAEETVEPEINTSDLEERPNSAEAASVAETEVSEPKPQLAEAEGVAETESPEPETQPTEKKGWLGRLRAGLSKSTSKVSTGISEIFTKRRLDEDSLDDLEDLLIMSDLGVETARDLRATFRNSSKFGKDVSPEEIKEALAETLAGCLSEVTKPLTINPKNKPHVVLMVGVNGSGKTTTIGKLSQQYQSEGKKVMLAAGDTFRAAAIEQLQVWGDRTGVTVVSGKQGADAAGLAFDAIERAQTENADVLLIDTAGRLQNKRDLMAELEKIVRVIKKKDPDSPHDTILVLDGTVGQNAISQVKTFGELVNITGLVVTKLDGSAKGGVIVGLADQFGLPIHAIGVGEGADDLRPFEAKSFARMLVGIE